MAALKTSKMTLPEVLLIEPKIFRDDRGFFLESFNAKEMAEVGVPNRFVQDNHSHSRKHVLRGLHYQIQHPQNKLVRVVSGEVFDVAVDIRKNSANFGKWVGVNLSAENGRMLWVPEGFAHGFLVLSDSADLVYKVTEFYAPQFERTIRWNDSELDIRWPLNAPPIVSEKDEMGLSLHEAEIFL